VSTDKKDSGNEKTESAKKQSRDDHMPSAQSPSVRLGISSIASTASVLTLAAIIVLAAWDYLEIRTNIRNSKEDIRVIREFRGKVAGIDSTISSSQVEVERLREFATVEYGSFYRTFLQYHLWDVLELFTVNADLKSIAELDLALDVLEGFFSEDPDASSEDEAKILRLKQHSEIKSYAEAFKLIRSLVNCQKMANRWKERRDGTAKGMRNRESDSLRNMIKDSLYTLAVQSSSVSDSNHAKIQNWIKGNARLIIYKLGIDKDPSHLRAASDAFRRGLRDTISCDRNMDSELRISLAIAMAALSEADERTDLLDSAIYYLNINIEEGHTWDASLFNNLADYQTRKAVLLLTNQTGDIRGDLSAEQRDTVSSLLRNAESNIRMAVARALGRPTYRVTLPEILSFQYATSSILDSAIIIDVSDEDLQAALRDIFALSYVEKFHSHLFGIKSEGAHRKTEPDSRMMRLFASRKRNVFDALKTIADREYERLGSNKT
jgi:hypothetical protein